MHALQRLLIASVFTAAGTAALAGSVDVTFVNSRSYTGAGTSSSDEQANLQTLAAYFQKLGERYLPADQKMKVEVLDADFAGTVRPSRRNNGQPLRIDRGKADWPKMHVRYALAGPGIAKSGDEWISDPNYTRGPQTGDTDAPLYYEQRMLERWFKQKFATG